MPSTSEFPYLEFATKFLRHFEYLPKYSDPASSDWTPAVRKFQELFGLNPDGIWGPITNARAMRPRCGCRENFRGAGAPLARWNKAVRGEAVTWRINSWDEELPQAVQVQIFIKAFQQWSDVCGIHFVQLTGRMPADITIDFGVIDQPGQVLAWSELPYNGGGPLRQMYDLRDTYVADLRVSRGIALLNVACHEIGHAIGLEHITSPRALLNPIYDPNIEKPLTPDIEEGIKRYGRAVVPVPEPIPTPTPAPTPTPDPEPTPKPTGGIMRLLEILRALVAFVNSDAGRAFLDLLRKFFPAIPEFSTAEGLEAELQQLENAAKAQGLIPDQE